MILAASVAVERVFSKGRLLLSHIRNRMSAHSTRALLCLGAWSKLGFVDIDDLNAAASLPDVGLDETWSDEEPECDVVA
jgi:hAT family C-terminal dimerisation region